MIPIILSAARAIELYERACDANRTDACERLDKLGVKRAPKPPSGDGH